MIINELIWTIFLIGFGGAAGYTIRDHYAAKANDRFLRYIESKLTGSPPAGIYGDPSQAYYNNPVMRAMFLARSQETDKQWLRMSLREYALKRHNTIY